MSLKAVHILFVCASMFLCAGFGAWAVGEFRTTRDLGTLLWGVGAFAIGVGMMVYGRWFLKKLRGVGYL
ncbi:MAG: hypothetical protein AABZ12_01110 [Planctomycetota bacterium]